MSNDGCGSPGPRRPGLPGLVDPAVFVARVLMADIFVVEGYTTIVHYADVVAYMAQYRVPGVLLPLVIVTELCGGLMVLGGLMTRWAAVALAGFAVLTALIFHSDFADAEQMINFQKNLAMAGGFLVLAAFGPGAWSLDHWRAGLTARAPAPP